MQSIFIQCLAHPCIRPLHLLIRHNVVGEHFELMSSDNDLQLSSCHTEECETTGKRLCPFVKPKSEPDIWRSERQ